MPIKNIQQRAAELGRIRLGQKVATSNGKSRPSKLDKFRFTSPNQRHIDALAQLYGGEPRPWDNNGRKEFEVITEATSIPVVVVPGGFSQWMETWSGGGCVHRCDGDTNFLTGEPCDPQDRAHVDAKPTTRLSVMLPQLDAIGVFRLESHGWNAAAELPFVVNLAQGVGDLVPANLTLHERVAIKDGKTSRFVVPGLDLEVTMQRVVQIANAKAAGIAAQAPVAEIGPAATDYESAVIDASSVDELKQLWRAAGEHGALTDELKATITARVADLTPQGEGTVPSTGSEVEPAGAVAAKPGESSPAALTDDPDAAWQQLLTAAGDVGIGMANLRTLLEQEFAQPVDDLTAEQMLSYIPKLGDAA